jgi:hypothetical protein
MSIPTSTSFAPLRLRRIQLLPRDFALLADVFDTRFITIPHAARLHFAGLRSAERSANRRLHRMAGAGLLKREEGYFGESLFPDGRRQQIKTIYRFTRAAFDLLVSRGLVRHVAGEEWGTTLRKRFDALKTSTIAHEVGMLDIKAALRPAIDAQPQLSVAEFGVWPLAYTFAVPATDQRTTLRPDGFLHVTEVQDGRDTLLHHFFYLEFDRGTEKHGTIIEKVRGYRHHLNAGGFLNWLGVGGARPRDFPFRVLFVVDTPDATQRRDNLAAALARFGVQTHTPLTTLAELVANPLGPIWITPKSHASGLPAQSPLFTRGITSFAPSRAVSLESVG